MKLAHWLMFAACAVAGTAGAQSWAWDDGTTPFVVSPPEVVERMLRLAEPKAAERLVDLGSGDGRIVIEAARRFGTRGLGVEIDPSLVARARANARQAGVDALAKFVVQDLFETDLRGVDIVTMYLLPDVNLKVMPRLLQDLKPGARVVSHDYGMGAWTPDELIELTVPEKPVGPAGRTRILLWLIPANAQGDWTSDLPGAGGEWTFRIKQQYQKLEADAQVAGRQMMVRGSRLRGEELKLVVTGNLDGRVRNLLFRGLLRGDRIDGEVTISDGEDGTTRSWTATRNR